MAQLGLAQSPTRIEIQDSTSLHHIHNYIREARNLALISDSTGIIVFQYNQLQNGYQFHLSAIDKERTSYFKMFEVPSQYTFIDNVLILIRYGYERHLNFPQAYHEAVDKLVDRRFKRLEEDKGAFVNYVKEADGTVHRVKSLIAGNLHNEVRIRVYPDGKTELFRDI
ncbi:hypothetical protein [Spirosoma validum]|uniref:Uncharacterized protein n=1 Tax=Spirosoma validum TaxID=2771355 RepID=A0A927B6X1_9BACT|nr:hypothetical protein [Spirosoma validum]MBD2756332.1 hypothetical protein [Spirosoma validum]